MNKSRYTEEQTMGFIKQRMALLLLGHAALQAQERESQLPYAVISQKIVLSGRRNFAISASASRPRDHHPGNGMTARFRLASSIAFPLRNSAPR